MQQLTRKLLHKNRKKSKFWLPSLNFFHISQTAKARRLWFSPIYVSQENSNNFWTARARIFFFFSLKEEKVIYNSYALNFFCPRRPCDGYLEWVASDRVASVEGSRSLHAQFATQSGKIWGWQRKVPSLCMESSNVLANCVNCEKLCDFCFWYTPSQGHYRASRLAP